MIRCDGHCLAHLTALRISPRNGLLRSMVSQTRGTAPSVAQAQRHQRPRQAALNSFSTSVRSSSGYGGKSGHSKGSADSDRSKPSWQRAFALAAWIPIAAVFMTHGFSVGQIKGGSMIPTFNPDATTPGTKHMCDIVLLNRYAPSENYYRVGDIVTLTSPHDPNLLLTKRILALEDDIVVLHTPVPLGRANAKLGEAGEVRSRVRIPPGHAWVEGDASVEEALHPFDPEASHPQATRSSGRSLGSSQDSRDFGPVPLGLVTARVDLILWPPARFGAPAERRGFATRHHATEGVDSVRYSFDGRVERTLDGHAHTDRSAPHPHDSRLTPYMDDDGGWEMQKRGRIVYSGPGSGATVIGQSADYDGLAEARRREDEDDALGPVRQALASELRALHARARRNEGATVEADSEAAEQRRRAWLNSLSRGGSLGTDSEEETRV